MSRARISGSSAARQAAAEGIRPAARRSWRTVAAADASADSLWQMVVLHGALGDGFRSELLSYDRPTYFGMLCAAFEPA